MSVGQLSAPISSFTNEMPILAEDRNSGPTIDWPVTNDTLTIFWDGIYTGQTKEVWLGQTWINDPDGVSTVIFRYCWIGDYPWMNKTATMVEGNLTHGLYEANFTYSVWWDFVTGSPETEGNGCNFVFKVWANDTLGNWSETAPIRYSGHYHLVNPPFYYYILSLRVLLPLIGGTIAVVVIILALKDELRNLSKNESNHTEVMKINQRG